MKKVLSKFQLNKIITGIGIICFLGFIGLSLNIYKEWDKVSIDRYNFAQFQRAKIILDSLSGKESKFYNLYEFNEQYNTNIEPINNCYYVSNSNGNEKYIFGFQLESTIYKYIYNNIYIFPRYNLPSMEVCTSGCYDHNLNKFNYIISNPCKE